MAPMKPARSSRSIYALSLLPKRCLRLPPIRVVIAALIVSRVDIAGAGQHILRLGIRLTSASAHVRQLRQAPKNAPTPPFPRTASSRDTDTTVFARKRGGWRDGARGWCFGEDTPITQRDLQGGSEGGREWEGEGPREEEGAGVHALYAAAASTGFGETQRGPGVWALWSVIHDALMRRKPEYHGWPQILSGGMVCVRLHTAATPSASALAPSKLSHPHRAHPPGLYTRARANIVYGAVLYSLALGFGLAMGAERGHGPREAECGVVGRWAVGVMATLHTRFFWGNVFINMVRADYRCPLPSALGARERRALLAYTSKQAAAYPSDGAAAD
ncbi:hypothetical protein B0H16DRAFT_1792537 [Mycena metata]|uniref:Uncharacterized protein n=1 Tax=Mycena metata TaxID=1033252 RepID=A0AAD7MJP3_9AGAR|nr:hypothetical protein B0H16DRAFT_1792537 [Mycena metata]